MIRQELGSFLELIVKSRGAFRILSNTYGEPFLRKKLLSKKFLS